MAASKSFSKTPKPKKTQEETQTTRFDFTYHLKSSDIPTVTKNTSDDSDYVFFNNPKNYENNNEFCGMLEYLLEKFGESCSRYCFQLEACPTSKRLHFQGRIMLLTKNKIRLRTLVSDEKNPIPGAHWSCTSKAAGTSFDYVMKEESRILGPWMDKSSAPKGSHITWDVKNITYETLNPWQTTLDDMLFQKEIDGSVKVIRKIRDINVILQPAGNLGKSTYTRWAHFIRGTSKCNAFNNYKDLIQFVGSIFMSEGDKPVWFFDIPKGMTADKLHDIIVAIEDIKSGNVSDTRHKGRDLYMNPPRIVIFTNNELPWHLLSKDKWVVHTINKDMQLIPYIVKDQYDPNALNDDICPSEPIQAKPFKFKMVPAFQEAKAIEKEQSNLDSSEAAKIDYVSLQIELAKNPELASQFLEFIKTKNL